MPVFMPGASRMGAVQASAAAVSMSSARPLASRAMTFMEAGTMTNRSQFRASQIWAISPGNGSSKDVNGAGVVGQGAERRRLDKAGGIRRQHGKDFDAAFDQLAGKVGGFVGGDGGGNAQHDALGGGSRQPSACPVVDAAVLGAQDGADGVHGFFHAVIGHGVVVMGALGHLLAGVQQALGDLVFAVRRAGAAGGAPALPGTAAAGRSARRPAFSRWTIRPPCTSIFRMTSIP